MSNASLAYLYQLQNTDFTYLNSLEFTVAVVDIDDAGLTSGQLTGLKDDGKTVYSYLSIGEAEDYRSYWTDEWNADRPEFILEENPNWQGNYKVAFWNSEWQQIIHTQAAQIVASGYQGMYLDIVDAYTDDGVIDAYNGQSIRQEMEEFVISLSEYVKSLNPNFKVIIQNAVELIALDDEASQANTTFLNAIDGLGVEDLFYDDNSTADWTIWDLQYISLAQEKSKFILATSYPTISSRQEDFLEQSILESLIPFIGTRSLDGTIAEINYEITELLTEGWDDILQSDITLFEPIVDFGGSNLDDQLIGTEANERFAGFSGNDTIDGGSGIDTAVYSSFYSNYAISGTDDLLSVHAQTGNDGNDTLLNIERIQFRDLSLALDINGNAGQAYRLYQSAFDRSPDLEGLGYWIAQKDEGMEIVEIAARFIDSQEFVNRYGADPSTGELVDAIYSNVLHREPDEDGRDFYISQIDNGLKSIAKTLADFSESEENKLQVIGEIQNGVVYELWNG
ncbi:MAG: MJ1477/TM1410 family putative glycoside hydrolase [Neptuniibacter sp.]